MPVDCAEGFDSGGDIVLVVVHGGVEPDEQRLVGIERIRRMPDHDDDEGDAELGEEGVDGARRRGWLAKDVEGVPGDIGGDDPGGAMETVRPLPEIHAGPVGPVRGSMGLPFGIGSGGHRGEGWDMGIGGTGHFRNQRRLSRPLWFRAGRAAYRFDD